MTLLGRCISGGQVSRFHIVKSKKGNDDIMATYDWQERHIIGLDGHEIALETKDLHALGCSMKQIMFSKPSGYSDEEKAAILTLYNSAFGL